MLKRLLSGSLLLFPQVLVAQHKESMVRCKNLVQTQLYGLRWNHAAKPPLEI